MPEASHTLLAHDREGGRVAPAADSITFRAPHRGRFKSAQGEGKLWEVTIIAAGKSLNGLNYSDDVLREALPLFVGLPVFSYKFGEKEKQQHLPNGAESVSPSGGGFSGNRVGQVTKAWWDEEAKEIRGLVAIDDQETRDRLKNAHDRGAIGSNDASRDVEGFSINMEGLRRGDDVEKIVRGGSLDMVTEPAAKGRYLRMVASTTEVEELSEEAGSTIAAAEKTNTPEAEEPKETEMTTKTTTVLAEADERISSLVAMAQALAGLEGDALREGAAKMIEALRMIVGGGEMAEQAATPAKDDRYDELAANVREMLKGDAFKENVQAQKLLESIGGPEELDEKDQAIAALNRKLREQAISFELAKFADRIVEGALPDVNAAVRVAESIKVLEKDGLTVVEGLEEAVETLLESKPWLRRAEVVAEAKTEGPAEAKPEAAPLTESKPKPEPRGQEIPLRESVVEAAPAVQAERLAAVKADLERRALQNDTAALCQLRKMRKAGVI